MRQIEKKIIKQIEKKEIFMVIAGFCFWSILFFSFFHFQVTSVSQKLSYYWISLFISGIHALLIGSFSTLFFLEKISFSSWAKMVNFTRGYFFYDIFFVFLSSNVFTKSEALFILHHIILIVIISYIEEYQKLFALGFISEIALPFLYAFLYLNSVGMKSSLLYYALGVTTVLFYFIFRVCNFTYLIFKFYYIFEKGKKWRICLFLPILFMNYFWFYKIVLKAAKYICGWL